MADLITCTHNSLSIDTIIASLIGKLEVNEVNFLGVNIDLCLVSSDELIKCSTHDEFITLFRRAIGVSDDGIIHLRLGLSSSMRVVTPDPAVECGTYQSNELLLRKCFAYNTNGEVCLVIHLISYCGGEFGE